MWWNVALCVDSFPRLSAIRCDRYFYFGAQSFVLLLNTHDLSSQPPPAKRGRGRPRKTEQTDAGGDEAGGSVEAKGKKKAAAAKAKGNGGESSKTDWTSVNWTELGQTKDGRFVSVCLSVCDCECVSGVCIYTCVYIYMCIKCMCLDICIVVDMHVQYSPAGEEYVHWQSNPLAHVSWWMHHSIYLCWWKAVVLL